jgi:hypothetical protein
MNQPLYLAAAVALAVAAPAEAATATLTNRMSFNDITLFAGNGPARVDFADGSPVALFLTDPALISVQGADSGTGSFGVYTVSFGAAWVQQQDYSFQNVGADAVLQASGSLAVTMSGSATTLGQAAVATLQYSSTNWQSFEFELDATTSYAFTGQAIDGQALQAFQWLNNGWVSAAGIISPGSGASISNSGTLTAGLYQIRNTPNVIVRTQTPFSSNQWEYTLTLHDTTVTAVPEPATVAFMLAGLGFIGWRLRRRAVM